MPYYSKSLLTRALLILSLLGFCNHTLAEPYVINLPGPQADDLDASYSYFVGLLELALTKSMPEDKPFVIKPGAYMVQSRALRQIQLANHVDVFWAGTSQKREKELRAIRIPLLKGLLGFRVSLMHAEKVAQFEKISTLEELLTLRPCQGTDWPDTEILKNAGFNVVSNTSYEGMFMQVNLQRCDFFPRGIHEAPSEFHASKKAFPDLRLYQDLIIYYPFPMYFFVNKNNTELAKLINDGLEQAIDDGSFDKYMRQSEITKHLFPLENWINSRYLVLKNPLLPADTDTTNPRYWIQVSTLSSLKPPPQAQP